MKPLKILIVDDQPLNRKLLTAQLEGEGHTVLEAEHGGEALAILESATVDVIISDILMPVMDGYRLCGEIRASARHRHLPFIFYTATYTSPADEEFCLQLGANKYLRKPVEIEDLTAAIDEVLGSTFSNPAVTVESGDILKKYSERLVFKLEQKIVELSEASSRLRLQATALDATGDAVVITDDGGSISWVNRAFLDLTGCAPDVIGRTVSELQVGLDPEVFHRAFWASYYDSVWRGEATIRRHDGAVRHVEKTINPVRAGDGGITHFVGVFHDVTNRKLAEVQLHEFLNHTPAVLYALALKGEEILPRLVSENVRRLLGFEVRETLSLAWWQAQLHPDDRASAEASVAETILTGSGCAEYRMRHKDGSYRWVEDNRRLTRDAEGNPAELIGVWTDVTARRRAQDELRESERRFQSMLANLELMAVTLDREARITYCNDHLLRLTGWTREELIGRDWFATFIPRDTLESMHATFAALLTDAAPAWHHENDILTRSGKRLRIQWNNSVLRSLSGEVIGAASIGEDITERRNLEQQMLRAQRLDGLGTLAGGIAHDLNNLLMPILMGATLLRRLEINPQSVRAIDNIELSVNRGRDLVKQVLLFARGAEVSRDEVQLPEIVREVQSIASSTFPKSIAFQISLPDDLRAVSGDRTQLTQVVLNLCVNARDAMPRGGQISISAVNTELSQRSAQRSGASAGGPFVILEVADSGEGMPREIIDRIFDPFFTTKEVDKGTGLGLSTLQGIVSNHGGFVNVASTVGEGTTFKVYLPARTGQSAPIVNTNEAAAEPPRGHGEVILVTDDDSTVLSITAQTLEAFGYTVIVAEDGAQALGAYSRRPADIALLLTDMQMPIIDGHALIAALTRIDPTLPIIAATGDTASHHLARIAKTGATVLTKPYTADHLLHTIADVLTTRSKTKPGNDPKE